MGHCGKLSVSGVAGTAGSCPSPHKPAKPGVSSMPTAWQESRALFSDPRFLGTDSVLRGCEALGVDVMSGMLSNGVCQVPPEIC
mmetsp:Transcript_122818/g.292156  ORF Transcript_122818/g.292156 Transcript_122818/m.292156 type:complete len:84 (+) Transcript_122818:522-773(+)